MSEILSDIASVLGIATAWWAGYKYLKPARSFVLRPMPPTPELSYLAAILAKLGLWLFGLALGAAFGVQLLWLVDATFGLDGAPPESYLICALAGAAWGFWWSKSDWRRLLFIVGNIVVFNIITFAAMGG